MSAIIDGISKLLWLGHRVGRAWLIRLFNRLIDRDKGGGIDRLAYSHRIGVLIKVSA